MNWTPGKTLEEIEKEVIIVAFRFFNNNKTHTAQSLGIAIRTLDNKLAKYAQEKQTVKVKDPLEIEAI